MLVSPDRPCKCGSIYWDIEADSVDRICMVCSARVSDIPLEQVCPGITAKIIKARAEAVHEDDRGFCDSEDDE